MTYDQRFNLDLNVCTFCNSDIQTVEHLFFLCNATQTFWDRFQYWISYNEKDILILTYEKIRFGLQMENKKTEFGNNNLILLATYFIHKCRFLKTSPVFNAFYNELVLYKKTIKQCKMKGAQHFNEYLCALIPDWSLVLMFLFLFCFVLSAIFFYVKCVDLTRFFL